MRRFENHLERAREKLGNEGWQRRARSAFAVASVPELWDDHAASEDLLESFFEYAEFVIASRSVPRIISTLQKGVGFERNASAQEIRRALEAYLGSTGWSDEDWLGPADLDAPPPATTLRKRGRISVRNVRPRVAATVRRRPKQARH